MSFVALKHTYLPPKLSPKDIIAQEDKPLEWIYLHYKDQKMLTRQIMAGLQPALLPQVFLKISLQ